MLSPLAISKYIKSFKCNASLDSRNLLQLSQAFPNLEHLEFETVLQPNLEFT